MIKTGGLLDCSLPPEQHKCTPVFICLSLEAVAVGGGCFQGEQQNSRHKSNRSAITGTGQPQARGREEGEPLNKGE